MTMFVWDGTDWISADFMRVYDGTDWKALRPLVYDGAQFIPEDNLYGSFISTGSLLWDVAAPTPATKTYTVTKSWAATWSSTYYGDNSKRTDKTQLYQGQYTSGSNGNMKSLVGFSVGSFPAGATCTSMKLILNAEHWYYNSGGTAVIGTHNKTTEPATFSSSGTNDNRLTYAWSTKTGQRTITLGTTIGNEFISGSTKGIMLGPGISTAATYYGYFTGSGALRPTIQMTYTYVA